jgi:hypothetical protein
MAEPTAISSGDFNGDGDSDIVVWERSGDRPFMVGLSDGERFTKWEPWLTGMGQPDALGAGDLNADGFSDIVVWEAGRRQYMVGLSDGKRFDWLHTNLKNMGDPGAFALDDVNGDGRADIIVWEQDANGANGSFRVGLSYGMKNNEWDFGWDVGLTGIERPGALGAGDVNRDGKADIVVYESSSRSYRVGLSNGDRQFRWVAGDVTNVAAPTGLSVDDVNGDGTADIVAFEKDLNGANGTFMVGPAYGEKNGVFDFGWDPWLSGVETPVVFTTGNFA